MTYLRFGIRDLLWAMALLAMGLGWWLEYRYDRERVKLIEEVNFLSIGLERDEPGPIRPQMATVTYPDGTTVKFEIPPESWEQFE